MHEWSNEELIAAFKKGNEGRLKTWYDEEKPAFISMSRKIGLRQTSDILDIYQDAMATLYVKIRDGGLTDLKSSLHHYLMSIGKYKSIDFMKRQGKVIHVQEQTVDFLLDPSVQSTDEGDFKKRFVKKAILDLGKKCKQVILLFYYEGLTISEIKEYMGYKDNNTVKSQKSRCVKSLKDKISQYESN